MAIATEPVVQWVSASPLWSAYVQEPVRMQRPALLRFATDTFMEELAALLASKTPERLLDYVAHPLSFRARPTGAPPTWTPPATTLKLFQPVHGDFNLIATSLVCRIPGMPDRVVDLANGEKVAFVLRRLGANGAEMAWIDGPQGKGWQTLTADESGESDDDLAFVATSEELHPLFPLNFDEDERRRRLLVGLIPTESRDSYIAAAESTSLIPDSEALKTEPDPRFDEVETRVVNPLVALKQPAPNEATTEMQELREKRQQEASRFMLLDLAEFLSLHTPTLWAQIEANTPPASGPALALYNTLNNATTDINVPGAPSWRSALKTAKAEWERITGESMTPPTQELNLKYTNLNPETLRTNLDALIKSLAAPPANQPTPTGQTNPRALPKLDGNLNTRYVLRCVFQRPNCGPLRPDVVSRPTEPFAISTFFDFDAPSRPIRIAMPVDTSVKGLRKFNKNVGILISDQLRQQMSSVTDLKKALDGNLASGEPFDLGVLCSFSIPIITICALIVLIIFLFLLNIVFWWLPFFRICLPINLKSS